MQSISKPLKICSLRFLSHSDPGQIISDHTWCNIPAQKAVITPAAGHGVVIIQTEGNVGVEHQVFGPGQEVTSQANGCRAKDQAGDDQRGLLYAETCSQKRVVQVVLVSVER